MNVRQHDASHHTSASVFWGDSVKNVCGDALGLHCHDRMMTDDELRKLFFLQASFSKPSQNTGVSLSHAPPAHPHTRIHHPPPLSVVCSVSFSRVKDEHLVSGVFRGFTASPRSSV